MPTTQTEPEGPALYILATPLGNLEDITLRALRILTQADIILSEDTRKTRILLQRHNIHAPLKSYRVHKIRHDTARAIELLEQGQKLAFCTDAGTPGVSDPGSHLVREVRQQLPTVPIIPIPGASALTTALSVCGWQANPILFTGFLSNKSGPRRRFLEKHHDFSGLIILYESVHRIEALLKDIHEVLPTRQILVAREMTKLYEEFKLFDPAQEDADFVNFLQELKKKGEFTVIIGRDS